MQLRLVGLLVSSTPQLHKYSSSFCQNEERGFESNIARVPKLKLDAIYRTVLCRID